MLDFDSIAPHLQIKIAEKIEFYDQREFEISSNCGKNAVKFTNHRAVVELSEVLGCDDHVRLMINGDSPVVWKTCEQLRKISPIYLPRLKVSSIVLYSNKSLDSLKELCERQCFLENEVHLSWHFDGNSASDFSAFFEFFNISSAEFFGAFVENLFCFRRFCEIPKISLDSEELPDDCLLKLQSSQIVLDEHDGTRIFSTTNLFFNEWFTKKRNFKYFECRSTRRTQRGSLKKEILFDGFPYSVIWEYNREKSKLKFLKDPGQDDFIFNWDLNENTNVYSIDRGGMKLLVIVCIGSDNEGVYAHEYSKLDELIRIARDGSHKLDFSSIDLQQQTKIAEKIDYYDLKEFELSSKCGKELISHTKEAVVKLNAITNWNQNKCTMTSIIEDDTGETFKHWKCNDLRLFPQLPRFKVSELTFENKGTLDSFLELCERRVFVPSNVYVSLRFMNCGVGLFSVLSKFFNVAQVSLQEHGLIDEEFFLLDEFCGARVITLYGETSDENLLKLRSERITLLNQPKNRSPVTANRFFENWFYSKNRTVKWLKLRTDEKERRGGFQEDILFSGLPHEVIWKFNGNRRRTRLILSDPTISEKHTYDLDRDHVVYSINRGDKQLLVLIAIDVTRRSDYLIALEYTQIQKDGSTAFNIKVV